MDAGRDTTVNRGERRKARTRAALVAAAQGVLAARRQGEVSIQQITDAADVGFGTFYNHFTSKQELFEAAIAATLEEHGRLVAEATRGLDDPAEVFAAGIRLTGRLRETHPQIARIVLNTGLRYLDTASGLGAYALRDLRAAADAGRLEIDDPHVAVACAGGSLLGLLHYLEARPEVDAARATDDLAAQLLRMFGLPRTEARRIASLPLPAP
ncbi:TetR/AcrR family transcriptional regulator [Actinocorallia sp. API 0066]|uniref:TetR/AcrR family transcriptional regulator n=1 Tax=Actinocorallia sp. API 0066 TaxID=2896846 RepID=UPI001E497D6A|nr:TetR/AcrR family transcriptional regulator [Actinocorallia sp. API 0066]MCD0449668.1 TetR/AcrR family transcriptional regulator [Actinocorallia sp. API 0066]